MSNTNNMNLDIINQSDTIRDFMEKCNDNFSKLSTLSGPAGIQGEQGEQGVPTKPKVPIHAWTKGVEYINDDNYTISVNGNELTDSKYQEGHLIILENAHVYVLEIEDNSLTPQFKIALQSYTQGSVIDGKDAYVHFAYADDANGANMIIPNQNYQAVNAGEESISTFSLTRVVSNNSDISEKPYMGMYCSRSSEPSSNPDIYTWVRIRGRDGDVGSTGPQGPEGPEGPEGPQGSPFTGQNYTIDLQGDMAMVSLNIDRTIRNQSSSCKCTIYAYYGDENVELNLNKDNVSFIVDENKYIDKNLNYKIVNDENNKLILWEATNGKLGEFTISQNNKDVDIEFKPEDTFIFPETTLIFPIQINSTIKDGKDGKTYNFTRKTIWSIKGIVSNFSLEIVPQYRTIKLSDGKYTPDNLKVYVYKLEDGTRTLFDLNEEENQNYKLLYKNYDDTDDAQNWFLYNNGIIIDGSISCLEFRLVKNYDRTDVEKWEIWDYEDVWVVANGIDGKDAHYYHADLGNTESMMVLTTGEKINISSDDNNPIYCAQLRDTSGYSITFNPKFYDGTEEYNSSNGYTIYINLGGEIGDYDGTFKYEWTDNAYTFTVKSVPYGIDMIPITFDVIASNGDETYSDSIPFNIYISTITNIYTLVPSVSAFNTSTGIDGDVISCAVYKNNEEIETTELSNYGLYLKYKIYNNPKEEDYPPQRNEGEPEGIKYGAGGFTAEDVGIEFILYYIEDPIVKSTIPLIKDGTDGEDGNNWQYIFCRLNEYPYPYQSDEGLNQNPSTWYKNTDDNKPHTDPNEEYIHEDFDDIWSDDHQGVDKDHKYEYQSYRKWNKEGKYWGEYTSPTLYSNYSEDGTTPTNISVTVLGYSIEKKETCENAIDINENLINANNSVWRPSISDWGSQVVPGQTIYILNKHTWNTGVVTRSISTTMAGTQGADGTNGKSRVLFYLGSFEDGTLKDKNEDGIYITHIGYLTDTRCDYYIDISGKAWMRIGEDKPEYEVCPNPNEEYTDPKDLFYTYWQESEKVGFLQAGAIHANMINADSLSVNKAFVEAIQTMTIYADEITGKTIKSGEIIPGSDSDSDSDTGDATWQISNKGEGWLASKNIYWDEDGNITINGKINGSIGNENDNVIIDGDLIINSTTTEGGISKPSLILCGKHPYPNIEIDKSEDDQIYKITKTDENRSIVFASGIYSELYKWTLISQNPDNTTDAYIPQDIYTKYSTNLKDQDFNILVETPIDELYIYDETEKFYFPFNEFKSAIISEKKYSPSGINMPPYYTTSCIYLTIDGVRYAYNKPPRTDDFKREGQIETAETIIFSNGEIQTNSLLVKSGDFYGTIHSDGYFSGELKDVTGSINEGLITNSHIYNSNIEIYNDYTLSSTYNDNSKIKKIFELNPSLTIGSGSSSVKLKDVSWKKQDKDAKNDYVATTNKIIGKLWVPKGDENNPSAKISLKIDVSAYQPRMYDGNKTQPMVKIYWRYVGNTNYSVGHNNDDRYLDLYNINIFQSSWIYPENVNENGGLKRTNTSNSGRECKWHGYINDINIESDKDGEIEILAYFAATLTKKQLIDYPSVTFKITEINVTVSATQTFESDSIVIGNNGAIILGGDGGQITTVKNTNIDISNDGSIKLMSSNQNHGIIITDNGIILYNSTRANNLHYANISNGSFSWVEKKNFTTK